MALATLLPPMARRRCARAGLDGAVLKDRDHGFDVAHYERSVGCRFRSSQAALFHYMTIGSSRGGRPRADFDPIGYRRRNPDVERAGYEPFAHYFHFGRSEGRGGTAEDDGPEDRLLAPPDVSQMLQRPVSGYGVSGYAVSGQGVSGQGGAKVDIVVPVYGSRCLTLRTIDSVLSSAVRTPYELIVVDDASPDPVLRRDLELLAGKGLLTLLVNERNLGFVGTSNRGFALHGDRDVVLLNSDTQVFGDWLDRLLQVLHSTPRTGTASPMSNAATILSYPVFLRDNHRLPGLNLALLDRLCTRLNYPPVELPTALGFCMAIKRACLDEVGLFDQEKFGRGYGEENDFSLRAKAVGWQHVAAANVFVWHRGGASFGAERAALIEAAQQTLERLHPGYAASVQQFIRMDPLRLAREALDAARIREDPRPKVLWAGLPQPQPNEEMLILRVVPDIAPRVGLYRIQTTVPVPNLRSMRKEQSVADWSQLMKSLAVAEVCVESSARRAWRQMTAAAEAAGIKVT